MGHKIYTLLCVELISFGLIVHSASAQQLNASASNGASAPAESPADVNGSAPENSKPAQAPWRVDGEVTHYTLGVGDEIHVSVWKNAELSQTVTIGPDGFVSLPLVGEMRVEGFTTTQLGAELKARLNAFVLNPQVTVSVVEIRSRQVYIIGEVGKPGGYRLVGPMSVLQLIAEAGGLSTFADRKGVYILREANGHRQRLSFNYQDFIRGKSVQNVALQPGDTVVVP